MKKVCNNWYVHISNTLELYDYIAFKCGQAECQRVNETVNLLRKKFPEGNIIKYNSKTKDITIIGSRDWNTANEPEIHWSYIQKYTGEGVYYKGKGQIYHNKWQFVAEDYKGFDVQKAKERTDEWNSIPNIKSHKSKIGYKNYWVQLLKENNLSI